MASPPAGVPCRPDLFEWSDVTARRRRQSKSRRGVCRIRKVANVSRMYAPDPVGGPRYEAESP